MHRRRARLVVSVVLIVAFVSGGCRKSPAAPMAQPEAAIEVKGPREAVIKVKDRPEVVVTDEDLAKYAAWWRDWTIEGHREIADYQATMDRLSSRYVGDKARIAHDPDFLAMNERARQAMKEIQDRMPVSGLKFEALTATIQGLATLKMQGNKVVYVPGRNEVALNAARMRYGDAIVDWVVAREKTIAHIVSE